MFLFILGRLPLIFLEYSTGWPDQFGRKENSNFTQDYPAKSVYSEILFRAVVGSGKRFEKRPMSHFQIHRSGTLAARDFTRGFRSRSCLSSDPSVFFSRLPARPEQPAAR